MTAVTNSTYTFDPEKRSVFTPDTTSKSIKPQTIISKVPKIGKRK